MTFPRTIQLKNNTTLYLNTIKKDTITSLDIAIYENHSYMLELTDFDGFMGYLYSKDDDSETIESLSNGIQIAIDDNGVEE